LRDEGLTPVAIGTTSWNNMEPVFRIFPILEEKKGALPEGMVWVLLLSNDGASLAVVRPRPPAGLN
jgi:hypothetical protein